MASLAAKSLGTALCLVLGLALTPAANAAFSGHSAAWMNVSTAKLPTPSGSSVSVQAECYKNGWYYLNLTISSTTALQYANSVEITVRKQQSGEMVLQREQGSPSVGHYATSFNPGGSTSALTYEIRSKYGVPSSANYWVSAQSLAGTITCRQ